MDQFGSALITDTIIPFIADKVLGNVEKDDLLKQAIGFKTSITETDKQTIIGKYSVNETSVIATDPEFKKIFWSTFFTWIETQKTIAAGDASILSKRLLPVNPDGGYYPEAIRNFYKFGFQATKAYEFFLINEKIDEKFEPNSTDASNEKTQLKNGELDLLKKKDGTYDYFSSPELRKALENVTKAAELYKRVQTIQEGHSTYMVSFNPLKADGKSTILDVNKEIWANQNYLIQIHLEQKVGLHFEGTPTVGENGVLTGVVIDSKTKRKLKLEVNLASPAKKRTYKFSFTNPADKGKNFSLKDDELEFFKEYTPKEILGIMQSGGEQVRVQLPPSMVSFREKQPARPVVTEPAVVAKAKPKASEPIKEQLDQTRPVEPPESVKVVQKYGNANKFNFPPSEVSGEFVGPMAAKEGFNLKFKGKETKASKFKPREDRGKIAGNQPPRRAKSKKKKKNPVLQIAKWHAIGFGAAGSGLMFFT